MSTKSSTRMTTQRKVILDELTRAGFHPTADEVYAKVKPRLPKISLGTVYRNLEFLVEQGIIKKLDSCGRQRRFDPICEQHSHIVCTRCGVLEDVFADFSAPVIGILEDSKGFRVAEVWVQFLGLCPRCSQRDRSLPQSQMIRC